MKEATFRCRTSLAAVLLRIRRRRRVQRSGGAQESPCSSEHRHQKLRSRSRGPGIRMKIGLSQEVRVKDAATNQADRQRKSSAREGVADHRKVMSEVFQGLEKTLP